MCLACTVPVRGRTVGNECLANVLGADAPAGPEVDRRAPGDVAFLVAGIGFLGTIVATSIPWTNSLTSSHVRGFFGSWEVSPVSWALLSAIASVLGLAGWLLIRLRPALRGPVSAWLLALDAAAVGAGAVLFLIDPPFATHPFLGPWLTLAAAAVAAACSWASSIRTTGGRREPVRRRRVVS
jgi:hypothetical protein